VALVGTWHPARVNPPQVHSQHWQTPGMVPVTINWRL